MSLEASSLSNMVDSVFEIDTFQSKMGDDKNIVTLSFSLLDKSAAEDLSGFLERGYDFILDSDVPAGEQSDGTYKVFVELERSKEVPDQINEIMDGLKKLTGNNDFRFRYYKNFRSQSATTENYGKIIPTDPDSYGINVTENNLNNYKEFFTNSYVESISIDNNDTLQIKKLYADPIKLQVIDFGDTKEIYENIDGKFDLMESYPEILFLTKYIGDYNISKYGDKLVFENQGKSLVVKRI